MCSGKNEPKKNGPTWADWQGTGPGIVLEDVSVLVRDLGESAA